MAASEGSSANLKFGPLGERLGSDQVWRSIFPGADSISEPGGNPPASTVYQGEKILGYLYSTYESVQGRGYAGEPFDIVAGLYLDTRIAGVHVLWHNEPIIKGFRPMEDGFRAYLDGLEGIPILQSVRRSTVVRNTRISVDSLSGATISANLAHGAVVAGARRVARSRGLLEEFNVDGLSLDLFSFYSGDWRSLLSEGSVHCRTVHEGERLNVPEEVCVSLITPAGIGRNLFGDKWHGLYVSQIEYGEQLLWIGSKGVVSWKEFLGNKTEVFFNVSKVVQSEQGPKLGIRQGDLIIRLLPGDLWSPEREGQFSQGGAALRVANAAVFNSTGILKIKEGSGFKPYMPWSLEFDFNYGDEEDLEETVLASVAYQIPTKFIVGSDFALEEEGLKPVTYVMGGLIRESKLTDWGRVWVGQAFSIAGLLALLIVVTSILLFEHVITKRRQLHKWLRIAVLLAVLVWLGWIAGAQLSIVNIFSYGQALFGKLEWTTLLFEPLIVILMVYTVVSLVLLGRGVFCGWLCPFGAFQELLSQLARFARVPQLTLSFKLNQALWTVKYLVVIGLIGISVLWSMEWGLQGAEVEPFKTAITLKFARAWPYAIYAILLLLVGLFVERFFCRFLCPLGGMLAILGRIHLFQSLKRRSECGSPCHACEISCPVQAIEPSGRINMSECFQCLDCQVDYYDDTRCPPLIAQRKQRERLDLSPAQPLFEPERL